jgi:SprT protein
VITQAQQQHIISQTDHAISRAADYYNIKLPPIPVLFDLKGRAAGMYRVRGRQRVIRYNLAIFSRYFDDNIENTVPHEVAHYVTDMLWGLRKIRPHGKEWKQVMHALGATPEVTCRYDLSGMQLRKQQRYPYQCDCTLHALSAVRHNRICQGKMHYRCRQCGGTLKPSIADAA